MIRADEELYLRADFVQQFTNVNYITGEDLAMSESNTGGNGDRGKYPEGDSAQSKPGY